MTDWVQQVLSDDGLSCTPGCQRFDERRSEWPS
jgi:hypothetical protein